MWREVVNNGRLQIRERVRRRPAIVGWATAELVGTDSGAVHTGCPLAQSKLVSEPLAKQDQGLGQW
jgi:hypothetical protein